MNQPAYTLTNESITVVLEGKTHTVQKGAPNFVHLRQAILDEDWEDLRGHLTVAQSVEKWAKGKFKYVDQHMQYDGEPIPLELNNRITELATAGEDPTAVLNFWERLLRNPSFRSVRQLWGFMQHKGIPLTPDGCFLAYKGVNSDYTDCHSRTFLNKPGAVHEMPRNQISDDPAVACHEGFHVGSVDYARNFGSRTVVCKVDPEHVVCVPNDSGQGKMRVCSYQVVGNYGSELPSTVFKEANEHVPALPPTKKTAEPKTKKARKAAKEKAEKATQIRKPAKGWAKFHNMDLDKLMKQGIMDLRQYAGKGLLILGASKIPGGKTALVSRIIEVRNEE